MTGTVRWPLERARDALDSLPVSATDEEYAVAIADVLLTVAPINGIIRLGIQFDARNAPCPVPVDKAARDWCTVTFRDKAQARAWIVKAALTGCAVARITNDRASRGPGGSFRGPDLHSETIRHVRDRKLYRAKRAAMTPAQRQELDDEIPF